VGVDVDAKFLERPVDRGLFYTSDEISVENSREEL
jgi:hypothetical protein